MDRKQYILVVRLPDVKEVTNLLEGLGIIYNTLSPMEEYQWFIIFCSDANHYLLTTTYGLSLVTDQDQ